MLSRENRWFGCARWARAWVVLTLLVTGLSACIGRPGAPEIAPTIRSELMRSAQYPGVGAYRGLYEITTVEPLERVRVSEDVIDTRARVVVTLRQDVAQWVKSDSAGGLGADGLAAYRKFRNAKAGEAFESVVRHRFKYAPDAGWQVQRQDDGRG